MVNIPLGKTDWKRLVADEAQITVKNRYFEGNPLNSETQTALLSRPGLKRWLDVGTGPVTQIYSQPGSFNDALFVSSGDSLYKVDKDETVTLIGPGIFPTGTGTPQMAATSNFGETPEYLYAAAGGVLWCYLENGFARNTLTFAGQPADGDIVRIDEVYYKFVTGSVDASSPAGTAANPWNIKIGATEGITVDTFFHAVNDTGEGGVDYSTALVAHTTCYAYNASAVSVAVRALETGAFGNLIETTETGANLSWGNPSVMEDGGEPMIIQIPTPDDVGIVSVCYIASFIIAVPAQGEGINGRFYWIEPGETVIEPLNFATAERSPDTILDARVMGDQIWFFGSNTTEVWYPSGDADLPFTRLQGKLFDHGVIQGTPLQVGDSMMVIDVNGIVYQITGGPQRVSDNSIEERLRKAIREMVLST